ncbi:hypothetical protein EG68_03946 [Paragonimus skrjabini miyazakii]|uniref:Uncharacterized protein n=1 Tax=Paragonimus skrjabini miyazakii TaxID=59628 RepID=A0A8S9YU27_9TREM|nr:hypothetical protein EG68_03946 [Paragonimus skrjabini miyazakii]
MLVWWYVVYRRSVLPYTPTSVFFQVIEHTGWQRLCSMTTRMIDDSPRSTDLGIPYKHRRGQDVTESLGNGLCCDFQNDVRGSRISHILTVSGVSSEEPGRGHKIGLETVPSNIYKCAWLESLEQSCIRYPLLIMKTSVINLSN